MTASITAVLFEGAFWKNLPARIAFGLAIPMQELAHLTLARLFRLPIRWSWGSLWSAVEVDYRGAGVWKAALVRLAGPMMNLLLGTLGLVFIGLPSTELAELISVPNLFSIWAAMNLSLGVLDLLLSWAIRRGDLWDTLEAIRAYSLEGRLHTHARSRQSAAALTEILASYPELLKYDELESVLRDLFDVSLSNYGDALESLAALLRNYPQLATLSALKEVILPMAQAAGTGTDEALKTLTQFLSMHPELANEGDLKVQVVPLWTEIAKHAGRTSAAGTFLILSILIKHRPGADVSYFRQVYAGATAIAGLMLNALYPRRENVAREFLPAFEILLIRNPEMASAEQFNETVVPLWRSIKQADPSLNAFKALEDLLAEFTVRADRDSLARFGQQVLRLGSGLAGANQHFVFSALRAAIQANRSLRIENLVSNLLAIAQKDPSLQIFLLVETLISANPSFVMGGFEKLTAVMIPKVIDPLLAMGSKTGLSAAYNLSLILHLHRGLASVEALENDVMPLWLAVHRSMGTESEQAYFWLGEILPNYPGLATPESLRDLFLLIVNEPGRSAPEMLQHLHTLLRGNRALAQRELLVPIFQEIFARRGQTDPSAILGALAAFFKDFPASANRLQPERAAVIARVVADFTTRGIMPTIDLIDRYEGNGYAPELLAAWARQVDVMMSKNFAFDGDNPEHRELGYTVLHRRLLQTPGLVELSYREYAELLETGSKETQIDIALEEDAELVALGFEGDLLKEMLAELFSRSAGRPVVVVENLSYGRVAASPLVTVSALGRRIIDGLGIAVLSAKIGSTESHGNPKIINPNLFSDAELGDVLADRATVVIVDASNSVRGGRVSAHYPDAFQGYRNLLIAINDAYGFETSVADLHMTDAVTQKFLTDLRAAPEFQQAKARVQGILRERGIQKPAQPLRLGYWTATSYPIQGTRHNLYDMGVIATADVERLSGPAWILAQTAADQETLEERASQGHLVAQKTLAFFKALKLNHAAAYFDDRDHFKRFFLTMTDYGPDFSSAFSQRARMWYGQLVGESALDRGQAGRSMRVERKAGEKSLGGRSRQVFEGSPVAMNILERWREAIEAKAATGHWGWKLLAILVHPVKGAPFTETGLLTGIFEGVKALLVAVGWMDPTGISWGLLGAVLLISAIFSAVHGDVWAMVTAKRRGDPNVSWKGIASLLAVRFVAGIMLTGIFLVPNGMLWSYLIHLVWNLGVERGWWNLPYLSLAGKVQLKEMPGTPDFLKALLHDQSPLSESLRNEFIRLGVRGVGPIMGHERQNGMHLGGAVVALGNNRTFLLTANATVETIIHETAHLVWADLSPAKQREWLNMMRRYNNMEALRDRGFKDESLIVDENFADLMGWMLNGELTERLGTPLTQEMRNFLGQIAMGYPVLAQIREFAEKYLEVRIVSLEEENAIDEISSDAWTMTLEEYENKLRWSDRIGQRTTEIMERGRPVRLDTRGIRAKFSAQELSAIDNGQDTITVFAAVPADQKELAPGDFVHLNREGPATRPDQVVIEVKVPRLDIAFVDARGGQGLRYAPALTLSPRQYHKLVVEQAIRRGLFAEAVREGKMSDQKAREVIAAHASSKDISTTKINEAAPTNESASMRSDAQTTSPTTQASPRSRAHWWEWVFQVPALGLALTGFGLPIVLLGLLLSNAAFALSHEIGGKRWNISGVIRDPALRAEFLTLFAIGSALNVVLLALTSVILAFAPVASPDVGMDLTLKLILAVTSILGLAGNIALHRAYNQFAERYNRGEASLPAWVSSRLPQKLPYAKIFGLGSFDAVRNPAFHIVAKRLQESPRAVAHAAGPRGTRPWLITAEGYADDSRRVRAALSEIQRRAPPEESATFRRVADFINDSLDLVVIDSADGAPFLTLYPQIHFQFIRAGLERGELYIPRALYERIKDDPALLGAYLARDAYEIMTWSDTLNARGRTAVLNELAESMNGHKHTIFMEARRIARQISGAGLLDGKDIGSALDLLQTALIDEYLLRFGYFKSYDLLQQARQLDLDLGSGFLPFELTSLRKENWDVILQVFNQILPNQAPISNELEPADIDFRGAGDLMNQAGQHERIASLVEALFEHRKAEITKFLAGYLGIEESNLEVYGVRKVYYVGRGALKRVYYLAIDTNYGYQTVGLRLVGKDPASTRYRNMELARNEVRQFERIGERFRSFNPGMSVQKRVILENMNDIQGMREILGAMGVEAIMLGEFMHGYTLNEAQEKIAQDARLEDAEKNDTVDELLAHNVALLIWAWCATAFVNGAKGERIDWTALRDNPESLRKVLQRAQGFITPDLKGQNFIYSQFFYSTLFIDLDLATDSGFREFMNIMMIHLARSAEGLHDPRAPAKIDGLYVKHRARIAEMLATGFAEILGPELAEQILQAHLEGFLKPNKRNLSPQEKLKEYEKITQARPIISALELLQKRERGFTQRANELKEQIEQIRLARKAAGLMEDIADIVRLANELQAAAAAGEEVAETLAEMKALLLQATLLALEKDAPMQSLAERLSWLDTDLLGPVLMEVQWAVVETIAQAWGTSHYSDEFIREAFPRRWNLRKNHPLLLGSLLGNAEHGGSLWNLLDVMETGYENFLTVDLPVIRARAVEQAKDNVPEMEEEELEELVRGFEDIVVGQMIFEISLRQALAGSDLVAFGRFFLEMPELERELYLDDVLNQWINASSMDTILSLKLTGYLVLLSRQDTIHQMTQFLMEKLVKSMSLPEVLEHLDNAATLMSDQIDEWRRETPLGEEANSLPQNKEEVAALFDRIKRDLIRQGRSEEGPSTADIWGQGRNLSFSSFRERLAYYLKVVGWETAVFRVAAYLTTGVVLAAPFFLFAHTIRRWFVKAKQDGIGWREGRYWKGLAREAVVDLYTPTSLTPTPSPVLNRVVSITAGILRSRLGATILFTAPFLIIPAYPFIALAVSFAFHLTWDLRASYSPGAEMVPDADPAPMQAQKTGKKTKASAKPRTARQKPTRRIIPPASTKPTPVIPPGMSAASSQSANQAVTTVNQALEAALRRNNDNAWDFLAAYQKLREDGGVATWENMASELSASEEEVRDMAKDLMATHENLRMWIVSNETAARILALSRDQDSELSSIFGELSAFARTLAAFQDILSEAAPMDAQKYEASMNAAGFNYENDKKQFRDFMRETKEPQAKDAAKKVQGAEIDIEIHLFKKNKNLRNLSPDQLSKISIHVSVILEKPLRYSKIGYFNVPWIYGKNLEGERIYILYRQTIDGPKVIVLEYTPTKNTHDEYEQAFVNFFKKKVVEPIEKGMKKAGGATKDESKAAEWLDNWIQENSGAQVARVKMRTEGSGREQKLSRLDDYRDTAVAARVASILDEDAKQALGAGWMYWIYTAFVTYWENVLTMPVLQFFLAPVLRIAGLGKVADQIGRPSRAANWIAGIATVGMAAGFLAGAWVLVPSAIVWALASGWVFSGAHKGKTPAQRAVLFAVGTLMAGVLVAPAVLFTAGLPVPFLGEMSGYLEAGIVGLISNLAVHSLYNIGAMRVHAVGTKLKTRGWTRLGQWMQSAAPASILAVRASESEREGIRLDLQNVRSLFIMLLTKRNIPTDITEIQQLRDAYDRILSVLPKGLAGVEGWLDGLGFSEYDRSTLANMLASERDRTLLNQFFIRADLEELRSLRTRLLTGRGVPTEIDEIRRLAGAYDRVLSVLPQGLAGVERWLDGLGFTQYERSTFADMLTSERALELLADFFESHSALAPPEEPIRAAATPERIKALTQGAFSEIKGLIRSGSNITEATSVLESSRYAQLSDADRALLRRLASIVFQARQRNIDLDIDREVNDRTMRFAEIVLDGILDFPEEILARASSPLQVKVSQIEDAQLLGFAEIQRSLGKIALGVSQQEIGGAFNKVGIRTTLVHEIFHKLAVAQNKEGTDLLFSVQDWIDFLLGQDYSEVRGTPIREYLDLSKHGLQIVKGRIRSLRMRESSHIYQDDPHEILAWRGTGQQGSVNFGRQPRGVIVALLQRNLLRTADGAWEFDPTDGNWLLDGRPRRVALPRTDIRTNTIEDVQRARDVFQEIAGRPLTNTELREILGHSARSGNSLDEEAKRLAQAIVAKSEKRLSVTERFGLGRRSSEGAVEAKVRFEAPILVEISGRVLLIRRSSVPGILTVESPGRWALRLLPGRALTIARSSAGELESVRVGGQIEISAQGDVLTIRDLGSASGTVLSRQPQGYRNLNGGEVSEMIDAYSQLNKGFIPVELKVALTLEQMFQVTRIVVSEAQFREGLVNGSYAAIEVKGTKLFVTATAVEAFVKKSNRTGFASLLDDQAQKVLGPNSWAYRLYSAFGVLWENFLTMPVLQFFLAPVLRIVGLGKMADQIGRPSRAANWIAGIATVGMAAGFLAGAWVLVPSAIVWALASGWVFSGAHKGKTPAQRAVLFAVGTLMAGVLVAPAVLFTAGLPVPFLGEMSGYLQAGIAGLVANLAVHSLYNIGVLSLQALGTKLEARGWAQLGRALQNAVPASIVTVQGTDRERDLWDPKKFEYTAEDFRQGAPLGSGSISFHAMRVHTLAGTSQKVILKEGPEHTLRSEIIGQRVFQAAGLGEQVPKMKLVRVDGKLLVMMEILEGFATPPLNPSQPDQLPSGMVNNKNLQAAYFLDLLIYNYDRTPWNMMFKGALYRFIDFGAGIFSSAQGNFKGFPMSVNKSQEQAVWKINPLYGLPFSVNMAYAKLNNEPRNSEEIDQQIEAMGIALQYLKNVTDGDAIDRIVEDAFVDLKSEAELQAFLSEMKARAPPMANPKYASTHGTIQDIEKNFNGNVKTYLKAALRERAKQIVANTHDYLDILGAQTGIEDIAPTSISPSPTLIESPVLPLLGLPQNPLSTPPQAPPKNTQVNPPRNSMDVSDAYAAAMRLDSVENEVMSPEEILDAVRGRFEQMASANPASGAALQKTWDDIRGIMGTDYYKKLVMLARGIAGYIESFRQSEPDRFIVHFIRDMGFSFIIQRTLEELNNESEKHSGALYLNTPMMGAVYLELHARMYDFDSEGRSYEEGVMAWFESRMAENDPGFKALAQATEKALEKMGVFDQEKVLLFDTGFKGTMPWYVYAVIRQASRNRGKEITDIKVRLIESKNRTASVGLGDLVSKVKSMFQTFFQGKTGEPSLLNLLKESATILHILETLGDRRYHPVWFEESSGEIGVEAPEKILYFYFIGLIFRNMAIAQHQDLQGYEDFESGLSEIGIKVPPGFWKTPFLSPAPASSLLVINNQTFMNALGVQKSLDESIPNFLQSLPLEQNFVQHKDFLAKILLKNAELTKIKADMFKISNFDFSIPPAPQIDFLKIFTAKEQFAPPNFPIIPAQNVKLSELNFTHLILEAFGLVNFYPKQKPQGIIMGLLTMTLGGAAGILLALLGIIDMNQLWQILQGSAFFGVSMLAGIQLYGRLLLERIHSGDFERPELLQANLKERVKSEFDRAGVAVSDVVIVGAMEDLSASQFAARVEGRSDAEAARKKFGQKGIYLDTSDPNRSVLYLRSAPSLLDRWLGLRTHLYTNNALYHPFENRLYVLAAAARSTDFALKLVLAHEKGKRAFWESWLSRFLGRHAAEILGNLYELMFLIGSLISRSMSGPLVMGASLGLIGNPAAALTSFNLAFRYGAASFQNLFNQTIAAVASAVRNEISIAAQIYLAPSVLMAQSVRDWMSNSADAEKWEWIFQAPAMLAMLAGADVPTVLGIMGISNLAFGFLHWGNLDAKTFQGKLGQALWLSFTGVVFNLPLIAAGAILTSPSFQTGDTADKIVVAAIAVLLGLKNVAWHWLYNKAHDQGLLPSWMPRATIVLRPLISEARRRATPSRFDELDKLNPKIEQIRKLISSLPLSVKRQFETKLAGLTTKKINLRMELMNRTARRGPDTVSRENLSEQIKGLTQGISDLENEVKSLVAIGPASMADDPSTPRPRGTTFSQLQSRLADSGGISFAARYLGWALFGKLLQGRFGWNRENYDNNYRYISSGWENLLAYIFVLTVQYFTGETFGVEFNTAVWVHAFLGGHVLDWVVWLVRLTGWGFVRAFGTEAGARPRAPPVQNLFYAGFVSFLNLGLSESLSEQGVKGEWVVAAFSVPFHLLVNIIAKYTSAFALEISLTLRLKWAVYHSSIPQDLKKTNFRYAGNRIEYLNAIYRLNNLNRIFAPMPAADREMLATLFLADQFVGDIFRVNAADFDERMIAEYTGDRNFSQLRYLLILMSRGDQAAAAEVRSLIQSGRVSPERVVSAILQNGINSLIVNSTELIMPIRGQKGILEGLTSLAARLDDAAPIKMQDILATLDSLGANVGQADVDKMLRARNFRAHPETGLIIPFVFDILLSVYRGSAETDHAEANYVTHALTTAIVHYANKGGEYKSGGEMDPQGANAFHEFDSGLLQTVGRTDRTVDHAVTLAFYHDSALPEFARKRTTVLKGKTTANHIRTLMNWQLTERRAKRAIQAALDAIGNGVDVKASSRLIQAQLAILRRDSGLRPAYIDAVFGALDEQFFEDLEKQDEKMDRQRLEELLSAGVARTRVFVRAERNGVPAVLADHPWSESGKTLLDYLNHEREVRGGTFDETTDAELELQQEIAKTAPASASKIAGSESVLQSDAAQSQPGLGSAHWWEWVFQLPAMIAMLAGADPSMVLAILGISNGIFGALHRNQLTAKTPAGKVGQVLWLALVGSILNLPLLAFAAAFVSPETAPGIAQGIGLALSAIGLNIGLHALYNLAHDAKLLPSWMPRATIALSDVQSQWNRMSNAERRKAVNQLASQRVHPGMPAAMRVEKIRQEFSRIYENLEAGREPSDELDSAPQEKRAPRRTLSSDLDPRPTIAGQLGAAFVGFAMAVGKIVNPEYRDAIGLYGASGAGWSSFVLSTRAQRAIFVDAAAFELETFKRGLDEWDKLVPIKFRQQYEDGYDSSPEARPMDDIEYKLLFDLKSMGVEKYKRDGSLNIRVAPNSEGFVTISFDWAPWGQSVRSYSITYVQAKIDDRSTYPPFLNRLLEQGIDFYYQKGSWSVPENYRNFLPEIAAAIRPGGALVTDDISFGMGERDPRASLARSGANFSNPIQSKEMTDWANEILSATPSDPDSGEPGYGWQVKVRKREAAKVRDQKETSSPAARPHEREAKTELERRFVGSDAIPEAERTLEQIIKDRENASGGGNIIPVFTDDGRYLIDVSKLREGIAEGTLAVRDGRIVSVSKPSIALTAPGAAIFIAGMIFNLPFVMIAGLGLLALWSVVDLLPVALRLPLDLAYNSALLRAHRLGLVSLTLEEQVARTAARQVQASTLSADEKAELLPPILRGDLSALSDPDLAERIQITDEFRVTVQAMGLMIQMLQEQGVQLPASTNARFAGLSELFRMLNHLTAEEVSAQVASLRSQNPEQMRQTFGDLAWPLFYAGGMAQAQAGTAVSFRTTQQMYLQLRGYLSPGEKLSRSEKREIESIARSAWDAGSKRAGAAAVAADLQNDGVQVVYLPDLSREHVAVLAKLIQMRNQNEKNPELVILTDGNGVRKDKLLEALREYDSKIDEGQFNLALPQFYQRQILNDNKNPDELYDLILNKVEKLTGRTGLANISVDLHAAQLVFEEYTNGNIRIVVHVPNLPPIVITSQEIAILLEARRVLALQQ